MSALIENLKALHYESVELNDPPNIVCIFLSMRLARIGHIEIYADIFYRFSSIISMSIFLRAACLSIRIKRRISNSVPTWSRMFMQQGDANVSIGARSNYSRIGRDSPSVSLFLIGVRETWVAYRGWMGYNGARIGRR